MYNFSNCSYTSVIMPGKGGLCWCLGGRGPPEIKFGTDYDSPLKPVMLDIPMPTDENELNAKFEELVVSHS